MLGLSGRQFFLLFLLFVGLFAASQFGPAYYHAYQFNDYIQQEVKFAVSSRKTPEVIRAEVVDKAKEYDIDIGAHDIRITRRGPAFNFEVEYHIPINLRVHHQDLVFHVNESGELFER